MGGGLATYSVVSAVSAEIVEGTLPTREAPSKSLRPELLYVNKKLAEHRKARLGMASNWQAPLQRRAPF